MKVRMFSVVALVALLVGLLPGTALAQMSLSVEFNGIVESLPDTPGWIGDWTVDGRTVHVTPATVIEEREGPVEVGACVEVEGMPQGDGSVTASKVKTKSADDCTGSGGGDGDSFYGTVETLPAGWIGDWVVSGRTVHVSTATFIDQEHGPVAVGAFVEVEGSRRSDGSVDATKIEVKIAVVGGFGSYVKFYGVVENKPAGTWIGNWLIGGRAVRVDAATRIEQEHGPIVIGSLVEVTGWAQPDGSVNAVKLESESDPSGNIVGHAKFRGFVEQLPAGGLVGTWVVSGRTVIVTPQTRIEQEDGPVMVNALVQVEGRTQADGAVTATEIEVKASTGGGTGGQVSFYGTVDSFPAGFVGTWSVSGRSVAVTNSTVIDQENGAVVTGATVEVKGILGAAGVVAATKIEVKATPGGGGSTGFVKFYGIVEDLPDAGLVGNWMVSGRLVRVTAATVIDQEHGPAQLGARVEVKGIRQSAGGSVDATKIEVKP